MGNTDETKKTTILQGGAQNHSGSSSFSTLGDGDEIDPQEFARLIDFYDNSFRNIAEGEVVKGTVVKVTPTEVIVDVGFKSEGIIPIEEFIDEAGQVSAQPGDIVDVLLERTEDREGYVVLSREKAEKMKIWDEVEKAFQDRKVVIGRVIERIKGGLAVDIGVRAFLPGSQIDVRPVRNLDALRGQELRMRVIKVKRSAAISCSLGKCSSRRKTPRRRRPRSTRSARASRCAARSRISPTTARSSTSGASTACCTSQTCRGAA